MLESDDGLIWRKRAVFQEIDGDETAFLFEPDGSVLAIGRRGSANAQLLRPSRPTRSGTARTSTATSADRCWRKWGDRYVVGGRKTDRQAGPKTSLCWLVGDQLHEFAELPSGGDNSYPGLRRARPTRRWCPTTRRTKRTRRGKPITAIYLADLEIVE